MSTRAIATPPTVGGLMPKPPPGGQRRTASPAQQPPQQRASRISSRQGTRGSMGSASLLTRRGTASSIGSRADPTPLQLLDAQGNDVTPRSFVDPGRRKTMEEMRASHSVQPGALDATREISWGRDTHLPPAGTSTDGAGQSLGDMLLMSSLGGGRGGLGGFSDGGGGSDSLSLLGRGGGEDPQAVAMTTVDQRTAPAKSAPQQQLRLADSELNAPVSLIFSETPTLWLLDMPGTWVDRAGEAAGQVLASHQAYARRLARRKENADAFAARPAQTINPAPKHKDAQTAATATTSCGTQASGASIADGIAAAVSDAADASSGEQAALTTDPADPLDAEADVSLPGGARRRGTIIRELPAASLASAGADNAEEEERSPDTGAWARVVGSAAFQRTCRTVERMLAQVGVEEVQARLLGADAAAVAAVMAAADAGRSAVTATAAAAAAAEADAVVAAVAAAAEAAGAIAPPASSGWSTPAGLQTPAEQQGEESEGQVTPTGGATDAAVDAAAAAVLATALATASTDPTLRTLWSYACAPTQGYPVACVAWNVANQGLIAVGHGASADEAASGSPAGLVCCWTIKNPEFPERVLRVPRGVTALAFSVQHPNLLAVGLVDGTVAMYDVKVESSEALLDSRALDVADKHTAPVWALEWVMRESPSGGEGMEVLVSAASDGRVIQWSVRKGLRSTALMTVKRVRGGNSSGVAAAADDSTANIARSSEVMSLGFDPEDANNYLVGTSDGHIHSCSCSYSEQFLGTYNGHSGPVYNLAWSPFKSDVFLSCSADWSVRLWQRGAPEATSVLQSASCAVRSAVWSPHSSTVIASISDATVDVWDLSVKSQDPIITMDLTVSGDSLLSCVSFSPTANAIVTGDSSGRVTFSLLRNVPDCSHDTREHQVARLLAALAPTQGRG